MKDFDQALSEAAIFATRTKLPADFVEWHRSNPALSRQMALDYIREESTKRRSGLSNTLTRPYQSQHPQVKIDRDAYEAWKLDHLDVLASWKICAFALYSGMARLHRERADDDGTINRRPSGRRWNPPVTDYPLAGMTVQLNHSS